MFIDHLLCVRLHTCYHIQSLQKLKFYPHSTGQGSCDLEQLRSLPKVSYPQMEELGLKHICVPKAHVLSLMSPVPQPSSGLQQDLGPMLLRSKQLGKRLGFPCSGGCVPFLSLCPSYLSFMHNQLRATNRRLCDLCLYGQHRVLPLGHVRVDHSASERTCELLSLAHPEPCVLIRAGLWLLPRVTKL